MGSGNCRIKGSTNSTGGSYYLFGSFAALPTAGQVQKKTLSLRKIHLELAILMFVFSLIYSLNYAIFISGYSIVVFFSNPDFGSTHQVIYHLSADVIIESSDIHYQCDSCPCSSLTYINR